MLHHDAGKAASGIKEDIHETRDSYTTGAGVYFCCLSVRMLIQEDND